MRPLADDAHAARAPQATQDTDDRRAHRRMPTVLVIEDEADIADNLCDLLEALGYDAVQAGDGTTGIETAQEQQPDLVICDIRMPERTGHEVLRAIRAAGAWGASVPFVFLTASAESNLRDESLELGADAFVRKPFNVDHLIGTIQSLVGDES